MKAGLKAGLTHAAATKQAVQLLGAEAAGFANQPIILQHQINMKIGIVAATAFEIAPAIHFIEQLPAGSKHACSVIITGVGIMAATYQLATRLQQEPFNCLLQAGIGGSFTDKLPLAQVVLIKEEVTGDLGVQEGDFRDVFDMGFAEPDQFPFTGKSLANPYMGHWPAIHLPVAKGVTVNEITTRGERMEALQRKYGSEIESMEGAAFHYVCLHHAIPFLQLRSVSNFVGERDKKKWLLHEAVATLNAVLISIIKQINEP